MHPVVVFPARYRHRYLITALWWSMFRLLIIAPIWLCWQTIKWMMLGFVWAYQQVRLYIQARKISDLS